MGGGAVKILVIKHIDCEGLGLWEDAEPYLDDPNDADDEPPTMPSIAYHIVGYLGPEPEEPDWMARQPQWFRDLLSRIETCPSLPELAKLGKQIYAMPLTHEQAGVAWTWYRIRKDHLQHTLRLSPPAQKLMQQLQRQRLATFPPGEPRVWTGEAESWPEDDRGHGTPLRNNSTLQKCSSLASP